MSQKSEGLAGEDQLAESKFGKGESTKYFIVGGTSIEARITTYAGEHLGGDLFYPRM